MAEETSVEITEDGTELDPRMRSALELARIVRAAVRDGDIEGHLFEDEEIIGKRSFSLNGGGCNTV